MTYQTIVLIVLCAVILITQLGELIKGIKGTSFTDSIIETGIMLIVSVAPTFNDTIASIIARYLQVTVTDSNNSILYLVSGFILITLGVVLRWNIQDRIYILNMHGIVKRDIGDGKAVKDLRLVDYKIKEQIIDFMPVFDSENISDHDNDIICKYIQDETAKFANKTEGKTSCFTGMAPIPYTLYAGTFLAGANVKRYFEFNRHVGEKYYELKSINLRSRSKKWPQLKEIFQEHSNSESTDVLLAISISHEISAADLIEFNNMDVIRLQLEDARDNVIIYYEQLLEYKKNIYDCLDVDIKKKYPNIQRIHLIASIPSCVSLEIGKSIGVNTNRTANVIVYHYVNNAIPKYPFGISVNGSSKGKIYRK